MKSTIITLFTLGMCFACTVASAQSGPDRYSFYVPADQAQHAPPSAYVRPPAPGSPVHPAVYHPSAGNGIAPAMAFTPAGQAGGNIALTAYPGPPVGMAGGPAFHVAQGAPFLGGPVDGGFVDGGFVPQGQIIDGGFAGPSVVGEGFVEAGGSGWLDAILGPVAVAPRYFDVAVDFSFLGRDDATGRLPIVSQGQGGPIVQSSNAFNLSEEAGFRATAHLFLMSNVFLEGRFFGTYEWADTHQVMSGASNLETVLTNFGTTAGGPQRLNSVFTRYRSQMDSAEINVVEMYMTSNSRWHSNIFAGVRYIRLDEFFDLSAGNSSVTSLTKNDLIGGQVGGNLFMQWTNELAIGGDGRVGVMGNQVKHDTTVVLPTGASTTVFGADTEASLVMEANLMAEYRICQFLVFRAGYQAMFINNVGLAPETAFAGVNEVNADGKVFYHGTFLGLEWTRQ